MNTRRSFLGAGLGIAASGVVGQASHARRLFGQEATAARIEDVDSVDETGSEENAKDGQTAGDHGVEVMLPRDRVPLSFVIDDSTCLVNMGHFCTPQFAEAWPQRPEYQKPWRRWPREIPDRFVRKFGEWCSEHGVKGKYSIVPYPACVGWVDREMPGWSRQQLESSLALVRDLMVPDWDIHPEMITHTRVIDLKTGRPLEAINAGTMENSFPQEKKSVDELASYLAYALQLLKNVGLPCEGITTPGGFGNLVKRELPQAVDEAVRDVFQVELPHYFKYIKMGDQSTVPSLEHVRGRGTDDIRLTVNVPAGTGDWFGGWQGDRDSEPDRYANRDATEGRMVELIQRREPAVMLCHWPGIYSNGREEGFRSFQRVVRSLEQRFSEQTLWMKLSEIGRYWAAKELTEITMTGNVMTLQAPFATDIFTLRVPTMANAIRGDQPLRRVESRQKLESGTWTRDDRGGSIVCIDLPKGNSTLTFEP